MLTGESQSDEEIESEVLEVPLMEASLAGVGGKGEPAFGRWKWHIPSWD